MTLARGVLVLFCPFAPRLSVYLFRFSPTLLLPPSYIPNLFASHRHILHTLLLPILCRFVIEFLLLSRSKCSNDITLFLSILQVLGNWCPSPLWWPKRTTFFRIDPLYSWGKSLRSVKKRFIHATNWVGDSLYYYAFQRSNLRAL